MLKKQVFIAVCYHKASPIVRTKYLTPIQVGRGISSKSLDAMIGDNTGDNISHKNTNWCELTALYWMWKNVEADHYGLMHYRRILNFAENKKQKQRHFLDISSHGHKKFGWNDNRILEECKSYDIITSPVWNVHPIGVPAKAMTNYDMYAREHFSRDIDIVEDIIRDITPEMTPFMTQVMTNRHAFFGNIMVMRKNLFLPYAEWLFNVLEAAERQIDIIGYDPYQRRIWGFIAERLANVYVSYAKQVLGAKVTSKPLVVGLIPPSPIPVAAIRDTIIRRENAKEAKCRESAEREKINVVFAIDANYVPHAAVTIRSAIKMSPEADRLRVFILHSGGLSKFDQDKLASVAKSGCVEIVFIKVTGEKIAWLPLNRDHISIETYFRLIMHDVLPADVKKVIYIDADTIVADSLVDLWNVDLNGKPIAACADEGGVTQARRLRLPLTHTYFNAGVAIFDLDAIRTMNFHECVIRAFRENSEYIALQDQDILNLIFCDNTYILPLRWNANTRLFLPNGLDPAYSWDEAFEAVKSPGIIHFTDRKKPWQAKCRHPLRDLYWKYRNETPWRETVLSGLVRRATASIKDRLRRI